MRDKFVGSMNHLIKLIYILFMLWTFLGALRDSNLEINNATGVSVGMLILLVMLFFILKKIGFSTIGKFFLGKYKFVIAGVLAIAVIAFQIYVVMNIHPAVGFDISALHNALIGKPDNVYYSQYPNNVSFFMYMHFWSQLFGSTSWLFLDLCTLVWTDLSAILNVLALYFINKKLVVPGIYTHLLWLSLFPMIIIPYTDCWVLPFVSLYILMWAILQNRSSCKIWDKIVLVIIMALGVVGAYFIKPSAIIPFIAIVIIELLACFGNNFNLTKVIVAVSFILAGAVSYGVVKHQIQNQKYIMIDKKNGATPLYYISLGLSEYGKYNDADAAEMSNAKTSEKINEISKKKIKERLESRGPLGYIKFLLFKQNLNTSDGTFGWLKEGGFISEPLPNSKGVAQIIRNYIYGEGIKLHDFFFIAQIWWIIWLGMLTFGTTKDYSKIKQMLRLAIIGGMLFLLLFEGGRSRYLIQFLPIFLILATIQAKDAGLKIRSLFKGIV